MRKNLLLLVLFILSLNLISQNKNNFNVYWKGGLRAESEDDQFKFKIGGRIQTDVMVINQNAPLNE